MQWVPGLSRCGWASETVWTNAENLDPPGFDPKTFQPVASRCTDYVISAPTVVRSQSKIEANNLDDFSARIVFLYTELDVVHILVFVVLEYGRHQKYPVVFRSAVNSVVDQINCQRTTFPLHKQH